MNEQSSNHPATTSAAIARALKVFVHGFAFTRSFTYPYVAEKLEEVWVMRDAPRKNGKYRMEEYVAHGVDPEEIHRLAMGHARGRFAVCVLCGNHDSQAPIRSAFKELEYRLGGTEPLMIHNLESIPHFQSDASIERVTTQEMADRLTTAARARQILPVHLNSGEQLRQYVALLNDNLVGWVRSIVVDDATWCSNMYVRPEFRRRGIARAMLSRMLHDDRAAGAREAVLLASHTGAKLYPVVGYEQIGTLLIYTPRKR